MRIKDIQIPEYFENLDLARDEDYCGQVLRDADLDEVAHFFIYSAHHYATLWLEDEG